MAEALGIASGAAGLLSLAIEVTKLSYSYIDSVRGSPKALISYTHELTTLSSVLLQLEDAVKSKNSSSHLSGRNGDVLINALSECKLEVESIQLKLEQRASRVGFKSKMTALAWPFSETELHDKVTMLHRYNGIFTSALQADSYVINIANNKELKDLRQDSKRKDIIAWYQPSSGMESAAVSLEEHCPSTSSVFLTDPLYVRWRNGSVPVLWAYGQPGAGKTMLAAVALRDIKSNGLPDTAIAYHFFTCNRPKESFQDVLRHLIAQVLSSCPEIPQKALALYDRGSHDLISHDFANVLGAIVKSTPTYIILDGLDECPVLRELLTMLSTLQAAGLKLFATSRDLPKLRRHFKNHALLEVAATSQDLQSYVTHRLRYAEVDFDLIGGQLTSEIATVIDSQAAGSFLLARLLMDHIVSLLTIKDVRKSLSSLPATSQEAYQNTFNRIVNQSARLKDLALKTLSLIAHVKRPLKILELQHALIAEEGMDEVNPEDLHSSKTIISSCLGLVVSSGDDLTIEFVHSTTKEFLRGIPPGMDPNPDLTIAQACLAYMSTCMMRRSPCASFIEVQKRLQEQPFLLYAGQFYGYHVLAVEKQCVEQVTAFLEHDNLRASSWQILNFKNSLDESIAQQLFNSGAQEVSSLHVAAFWGLEEYIASKARTSALGEPLISKQKFGKGDSHGWTSLHWAVSMGHKSVAKTILDAGVSPEIVDLAGWTPIFWAAFKGHREIVEILLERKAAAFLRDTEGLTPLHWATCAGHVEIVQRLLQEKNDPEKVIGEKKIVDLETIDDLTVPKAQELVRKISVSLLELYSDDMESQAFAVIIKALQRDASRGLSGTKFYSRWDPIISNVLRPLSKPESITLYRLEHGVVDITKQNDWAFRFLMRRLHVGAAKSGVFPVLQMSLDFEIVSIHDLEEFEVFHEAAASGSISIMRELVSRGVDVNRQDMEGRTPLHLACEKGQTASITMLLELGSVIVDSRDRKSRTPLMELLSRYHINTLLTGASRLDILNLFLAKGASMSVTDCHGNSLMHYAMQTWDPDVIQLFLDTGISIVTQNSCGHSPLHSFADQAHRKGWYSTKTIQSDFRTKRKVCISLIMGILSPGGVDLDHKPSTPDMNERYKLLSHACSSRNWDLASGLLKLTDSSLEDFKLSIVPVLQLYAYPTDEARTGRAGERDKSSYLALPSNLHNFSKVSPKLASAADPQIIRNAFGDYVEVCNNLDTISLENWLSLLKFLLDSGTEINGADCEGRACLHYCIQQAADAPIIEALLEAGANPYQATSEEFDCFHLALLYRDVAGSSDIMKCLREYASTQGLQPDSTHWFCAFGNKIFCKEVLVDEEAYYLEALCEASAMRDENDDIRKLLFAACQRGNSLLVRRMIAHGVDICITDKAGWAALHAAAQELNADTMSVLLHAGADVHQATWNLYGMTSSNEEGHATALHICLHECIYGNGVDELLEVTRMLLRFGADPNDALISQGDTKDETPLSMIFKAIEYASDTENIKVLLGCARLLFDSGARVSDATEHLTVGVVAKMGVDQSLWEDMRAQLVLAGNSD